MDVVVVGVDLGSVVDEVDRLVAIAAEGGCELVEARAEGVLLGLDLIERVARRLHGLSAWRGCEGIGRRLSRVGCGPELVSRILGRG